MIETLTARLACTVLCACALFQRDESKLDRARTERRAAIVALARRYATFEWSASSRNVLHGDDEDGVRVDTPDAAHTPGGFSIDGTKNRGVPYQWGGFSSLEEFAAGVAKGALAGHLPDAGSSAASARAVGVDCSGLVSRCWSLPLKQSTRSLGRLCYELSSFDELEPGDAINDFDGHAVLFIAFDEPSRSRVRVIEAGFPCVCESVYDVAELKRSGMRALRYKPLDPRWRAVHSSPADRVIEPSKSDAWGWRAIRSVQVPDAMLDLRGVRAGDWARYRESGGRASDRVLLRTVVETSETAAALRFETVIGGAGLETEQSCAFARPWIDALVDFAGSDQLPDRFEVRRVEVERGSVRLGGDPVAAERITIDAEAVYTVRGTRVSTDLAIECLRSDAVPLEGVIRLAIAGRASEPSVIELAAFHRERASRTSAPSGAGRAHDHEDRARDR